MPLAHVVHRRLSKEKADITSEPPDPRRSARSTKGVNSRFSEINTVETASPTPAKHRKSTPKNSTPASESPGKEDGVEGKPDDIIRCVCGASEEDEDDDRMMIQCEGCDAWQHTQCMGILKKKIPKQYFCEICSPEQHEFLLGQMALGEKPWEKKGGTRKRALAKQKEVLLKQKEATKETAPKSKGKTKETTPARGKRGAPTTEKPKAIPTTPAPPTAVAVATKPPRTTSRSRSAINRAVTKASAPPAIPKAEMTEKAAPDPDPLPTAESAEERVVGGKEAPLKEKNDGDVPMEDANAANGDKMDIDASESEVPVADSPSEALDRADRDATIPMEDMPPPPAPIPPPQTPVEAKPTKVLPPIVTDVTAQRPKNKREGGGTVMAPKPPKTPKTPKTPKSVKRKPSVEADSEHKGDGDKVSKLHSGLAVRLPKS